VLAGNAVNLLIFTVGRLENRRPPLLPDQASNLQLPLANALPQALILTAIVIGFALLSFVFILFYRAYQALDTVDTELMQAAENETRSTCLNPTLTTEYRHERNADMADYPAHGQRGSCNLVSQGSPAVTDSGSWQRGAAPDRGWSAAIQGAPVRYHGNSSR
jgi:multicomponent Na+:H+ antiporter subunit C